MRTLSRNAAADVDGWIAQARKLQRDIDHSQQTARDIVTQTQGNKERTARVQDCASKVSLLHSEIAYSRALGDVVEQLKAICTLLDSAQHAATCGEVMAALHTVDEAAAAFSGLGTYGTTRVAGVLKTKEAQLRKHIAGTVTASWDNFIRVDSAAHTIKIMPSIEREVGMDLTVVVDALNRMNLLNTLIIRLRNDLDKDIIAPRLTIDADPANAAIVIQGNRLQRTGRIEDGSVKATLQDIHAIVEYLTSYLPTCITVPLSVELVPVVASRLIASQLSPAIPISTDQIPVFQETLSYVLGLAEYLDELEWSGQTHLTDFVDRSPDLWLARQKASAIARVQTIFSSKVQQKLVVERVETQVVSRGDALHTGEDQNDDWGEDWDDEADTAGSHREVITQVEEEDMSAWGEEEPGADNDPSQEINQTGSLAEDGDVDNWDVAWGDDDETRPVTPSKPPHESTGQTSTRGNSFLRKPLADQEMTLRESYTVTAIPDSVTNIVVQVVKDVEILNAPDLVKTAIAPAGVGLYAIPGLLLAMYRATAVLHYSKDAAGNMLIYNDCQRLSDRLRGLLTEWAMTNQHPKLPQHLQPVLQLKPSLESDIKSIDGFGKRAYGREMESQRQILRDHLEDAQGFQGCTHVPFATVCDDAIAMAIDRIAAVRRQWQDVLSRSALLQSMGSLVSAVLTKFINDIEDMSDIAEDESRKLHGYCLSLTTLSQHFQAPDGGGVSQDTTSIYTPNWFKFQYLTEILDSSLADIKYFWTEGELKLEMEAEEVVGLIEALFAPSDHRRRAISEIRRTSIH